MKEKVGRCNRVDKSKIEITDDTDYEVSRCFQRVVDKKNKTHSY